MRISEHHNQRDKHDSLVLDVHALGFLDENDCVPAGFPCAVLPSLVNFHRSSRQSDMRVTSALLAWRFILTTLHLLLVVSLYMSGTANILTALPVKYTSDQFSEAKTSSVALKPRAQVILDDIACLPQFHC